MRIAYLRSLVETRLILSIVQRGSRLNGTAERARRMEISITYFCFSFSSFIIATWLQRHVYSSSRNCIEEKLGGRLVEN